jgi:hypothetical protein
MNDRAGPTPFVVVFDRVSDAACFYDRHVNGRELSFGTTGYAFGDTPDPSRGRPLLYDRASRSLWLPENAALVCVNGELQGTKLPRILNPEETTWSSWLHRHPQTLILVGNDRDKPIPRE